MKKIFSVHMGYTPKGRDKWRNFDTLEKASAACQTVFAQTRIVLSITERKVRNA